MELFARLFNVNLCMFERYINVVLVCSVFRHFNVINGPHQVFFCIWRGKLKMMYFISKPF